MASWHYFRVVSIPLPLPVHVVLWSHKHVGCQWILQFFLVNCLLLVHGFSILIFHILWAFVLCLPPLFCQAHAILFSNVYSTSLFQDFSFGNCCSRTCISSCPCILKDGLNKGLHLCLQDGVVGVSWCTLCGDSCWLWHKSVWQGEIGKCYLLIDGFADWTTFVRKTFNCCNWLSMFCHAW
jgi:hypothetical protein